MIPRKLHRIWLGSKEIPSHSQMYWEKWRDLLPSWELITWTEDNLFDLQNEEQYDRSSTYSERSDVIRFEILRNFGGVYVDVDVEPLKAFDHRILRSRAFAGWEYSHKLGTAVMGAQEGHRAIEKLVVNLPKWVSEHEDGRPDQRTGPLFLTSMWWREHQVDRFPKPYFYPYAWFEMEKREIFEQHGYPRQSYCAHHWMHSWHQDDGSVPTMRSRDAT